MCLAWDRVQIVLAARTRVHTFVSVVDSLARFTLLQPLSRFAFIFTIPVDGEKKIGWETALASPALAQRRTATYRQYEFDDVFAAYIKIGHRVAPKRDNATCCYAISFDFHVAVAIAIATFSLRGNQKKGTERVMMIQIQFSQPFTFCHLSASILSIDGVFLFFSGFFVAVVAGA